MKKQLYLALGLISLSCAASTETDDMGDNAAIGAQALTEMTCTTAIPGQTRSIERPGCTEIRSTSPDASYNPAGCSNAWLLHVDGTSSQYNYVHPEWADTPLTSANCSSARVSLHIWHRYKYARPEDAYWQFWESVHLKGVWRNGGCAFEPTVAGAPYDSGVATGTPYLIAARVSAQATLAGIKKRVRIASEKCIR